MGRVRPFDGGLPGLALNTKGLRENNRHSAGLKKKIRRLGAFKVGFDGIWITRNGDFSIKLGIFQTWDFLKSPMIASKEATKRKGLFQKKSAHFMFRNFSNLPRPLWNLYWEEHVLHSYLGAAHVFVSIRAGMVRIDTSQDDANALLSKLSENRRQNVDICRGKQPLICNGL